MTRYAVTAERGSGARWVFQCPAYPGAISEGRRLRDAFLLMPEAIGFVAEVPEEDVEIDLIPSLPEPLSTEVSMAPGRG